MGTFTATSSIECPDPSRETDALSVSLLFESCLPYTYMLLGCHVNCNTKAVIRSIIQPPNRDTSSAHERSNDENVIEPNASA
jgi:hypothetical protein